MLNWIHEHISCNLWQGSRSWLITFLSKFLNFVVYTEHPWIREGGVALDRPIDSAVISRMKQFRAMNKLKKLAVKVRLRFSVDGSTVFYT